MNENDLNNTDNQDQPNFAHLGAPREFSKNEVLPLFTKSF